MNSENKFRKNNIRAIDFGLNAAREAHARSQEKYHKIIESSDAFDENAPNSSERLLNGQVQDKSPRNSVDVFRNRYDKLKVLVSNDSDYIVLLRHSG